MEFTIASLLINYINVKALSLIPYPHQKTLSFTNFTELSIIYHQVRTRRPFFIKAIGGVRVKIFILSYFKELHKGTKSFLQNVKINFRSKVIAL